MTRDPCGFGPPPGVLQPLEEGLKDLTFSVGSSYTTGSFKYFPISFHITYLHHVTPLVVELCFICFIFSSQSMRMMTMTTCQIFRFLQGWWPRQKWSGEWAFQTSRTRLGSWEDGQSFDLAPELLEALCQCNTLEQGILARENWPLTVMGFSLLFLTIIPLLKSLNIYPRRKIYETSNLYLHCGRLPSVDLLLDG